MALIALVRLRTQEALIGDTVGDVVNQVRWLQFDWDKRKVVINGVPDGVSFCPDLDAATLTRFVRSRKLEILKRMGWSLFKEV